MKGLAYVLVAVGLLLGEAAQAAVIIPPVVVTVRVYNAVNVTPELRARALSAAALAMADADIEIVWKSCDLPAGADRSACERPLSPSELALRFVDTDGAGRSAPKRPLGDALVDPRTGGGVLATIYLDRVHWLADEAGADVATLLGRAAAHEITHLLLGSSRHESHGLMRAVWTCDDLRPSVRADWSFSTRQRAQIYAAAARRESRR